MGEAACGDAPDLRGWRRAFASFRNPNYRVFYVGQGVSLIGSWTRTSALAWLAFQWTGSEFMTGMVSFVNTLPTLLFSLYAGSLADRRSKIGVFKATSWAALVVSTTASILLFGGAQHVSWLLAFGFLWGLTMAFEMPARQALVVDLVGRKDLTNAIALNSALFNTSRVIGPALGGLLLASAGAVWCFIVDALSYLAVIFSLGRIRLARPDGAHLPVADLREHVRSSLHYVAQHPKIARTFALLVVMSVGGWAFQPLMAPFVITSLNLGAWGYGWMLSLHGLGAMTGALTVAYLGDRLRTQRPALVGIFLFSVCMFFLGFQRSPAAAGVFLFGAGFGLILFFSTSNSFLQSHVPDGMRGRVMGLWALAFGGGMPLGNLWMGALARQVGTARTFQVAGLVCLVAGFAVYQAFERRLQAAKTMRN